MNCPLCTSSGQPMSENAFYKCLHCSAIYKNNTHYLNADEEKKRYLIHDNDVNDPGYQSFTSPVTHYVLTHFNATDHGLDFGSGTGPVISKQLHDNNYSIEQYDPFFANDIALLNKHYDYIVCCEVIEHFYQPNKEFELLRNLLKPEGALVCMTNLYDDDTDFDNWYYKNDPTHVFFYHAETIKFIADTYGFSSYEITGRLIIFKA